MLSCAVLLSLFDDGRRNPIYINPYADVLEVKGGESLYRAYEFEDYKLKVNGYIEKNRDHLVDGSKQKRL